jgi:hypothetical protein
MEIDRKKAVKIISDKLGDLDKDSLISQFISMEDLNVDRFICWLASVLQDLQINKDTIDRLKEFKQAPKKDGDSRYEGSKHMFYSTLLELRAEHKFYKSGYKVVPIKPNSSSGKTTDFIIEKENVTAKVEASVTDFGDLILDKNLSQRTIRKIVERVKEKSKQSTDILFIENKPFFNYITGNRDAAIALRAELNPLKLKILVVIGADFGIFDTLPESEITQKKIDSYSGMDGLEFIRHLNESGTVEFWLVLHNHSCPLDSEMGKVLDS